MPEIKKTALEKYPKTLPLREYIKLKNKGFTFKAREMFRTKNVWLDALGKGIDKIPVAGPILTELSAYLSVKTMNAIRRKKLVKVISNALEKTKKEFPNAYKRILLDISKIIYENETLKKINSPIYDEKLKEKIYAIFDELAVKPIEKQAGKKFFREQIRNLMYDFKFMKKNYKLYGNDLLEYFSVALGKKLEGISNIKPNDERQISFLSTVFGSIYPELNDLKQKLIDLRKQPFSEEKEKAIMQTKNRMMQLIIRVNAEIMKKNSFERKPFDENFFKDLCKDVETIENEFNEKNLSKFVKKVENTINKLRKWKISSKRAEQMADLTKIFDDIKLSQFKGYLKQL